MQVETVCSMAEETRVEGNVSSHIYFKYLTASCNLLVLSAIVLLSVVAEVSQDSVALILYTNTDLIRTGKVKESSGAIISTENVFLYVGSRLFSIHRLHTFCRTGGWYTGEHFICTGIVS